MSLDATMVLDYYELESELRKLDAVASPSEAHGILCGQLSGGLQVDPMQWFNAYMANIGFKKTPWEGSREWFCLLHKFTLEELSDNQFNFMPLLPDDDDALNYRLESLAEWCSGFLAGFGTSGSRSPDEFNSETLSALKDIQQISQVDPEVEEDPDDETGGEAAYFEVVEYVRMAALMIFTEFSLKRDVQVPPNATIH